MFTRAYNFILQLPLEAFVWFSGLIALSFFQPDHGHFTICPFKNLGFDFCPGCGLGRSISFFFHGDLVSSFQTHPLGIIAVIILSHRIIQLSKLYLQTHGKSY